MKFCICIISNVYVVHFFFAEYHVLRLVDFQLHKIGLEIGCPKGYGTE